MILLQPPPGPFDRVQAYPEFPRGRLCFARKVEELYSPKEIIENPSSHRSGLPANGKIPPAKLETWSSRAESKSRKADSNGRQALNRI